MKLSALNTAIRDLEGAPWIETPTPLGIMRLSLQKTPLLAELKRLGGGETGIKLTVDGHLVREDYDGV